VLPGFLDREEALSMRADADSVLRAPLPPGCERPHNTLAPLRWNAPIVGRVLGSRRRRELLTRVTGAEDLRWISAYLSVKSAGSGPLWWHQDWWCWDHSVTYRHAPSQVAVLCYLADTGPDNGALRVIPGTHHASIALHAALPEAHAGETDPGPDHASMNDHPDQLTAEVRAGDAVVTDYRLLHGTHSNPGAQRRDCVLLNFTPSWRDLPADIRAHLIRHPALPGPGEQAAGDPRLAEMLPEFDGEPRDLPLSRVAPPSFAMSD
jgi:hypothetical protein